MHVHPDNYDALTPPPEPGAKPDEVAAHDRAAEQLVAASARLAALIADGVAKGFIDAEYAEFLQDGHVKLLEANAAVNEVLIKTAVGSATELWRQGALFCDYVLDGVEALKAVRAEADRRRQGAAGASG
jgi:hypothetical protein